MNAPKSAERATEQRVAGVLRAGRGEAERRQRRPGEARRDQAPAGRGGVSPVGRDLERMTNMPGAHDRERNGQFQHLPGLHVADRFLNRAGFVRIM